MKHSLKLTERDFICCSFNNCLKQGAFPNDLEKAKVRPIYKENKKTRKSNYKPVNILLSISKICESVILNQMRVIQ